MGDNGGSTGEEAYLLGREERRRLELLEQCLDPMTTRSLDAIGVEKGWRCLELGGGAGSITRMLCERVGPAGRVTAVDLDTRFLDESARTISTCSGGISSPTVCPATATTSSMPGCC